MMQLVFITGLSGSGKSVALHTLEDEGFYCIDNLPTDILHDVLDRLMAIQSDTYQKLAIGVDMRSERNCTDGLLQLFKKYSSRTDVSIQVLFLDTDRGVLSRRFSETRRLHPLSGTDLPLATAIDTEARLLVDVKAAADHVIDTSSLSAAELSEIIRQHVLDQPAGTLLLVFQSFGFKNRIPTTTDYIFDVRCLPNPYWEAQLRDYTGRDQPIIDFLDSKPEVTRMYEHIRDFLAPWLPEFANGNRAYLTVSIGCTGGRHRSVYISERLAEHFRQSMNNVSLRHRELS
ncbi:MAG: RNase adapter RapZ [Gammaproteobacteria bacterium]|nr:RNase adapter RapZ [Gammaproteobacteria bacterium]